MLVPTLQLDFIGYQVNSYSLCIKDSTLIKKEDKLKAILKVNNIEVNTHNRINYIKELVQYYRDFQTKGGPQYKVTVGGYLALLGY